MNKNWQDFLQAQGAQLDAEGNLIFSNMTNAKSALATQGVICSLDHLGCIRASGQDARDFLQAQLSNDINDLQNNRAQLSAYCNPKGRMLAQFLVLPAQDDFLLILPRTTLAATLKRLRMFVLRSQVVLDDASDDLVCLGLAGDALPDLPLPLPEHDYDLASLDGSRICRLPSPTPRYLHIADADRSKTVWSEFADSLLATDQHLWHWLDIQAGLPSIWPQTVEEFVPQMVNLELINGVNFKKGCYPGQEIVARMHYLGKPKRRMYRLTLDQSAPPLPGADIYVAGSDGQSAGKVVLAEPDQSGSECLAVLRNDSVDADLRLGSVDGPRLSLASLPYSLESS